MACNFGKENFALLDAALCSVQTLPTSNKTSNVTFANIDSDVAPRLHADSLAKTDQTGHLSIRWVQTPHC